MSDHPLVQLSLARMREFYREPEAVFWVFGFPIVLAFALGIAFRNRGPGELRVAVLRGPGDSVFAAAVGRAPGSPRSSSTRPRHACNSAQGAWRCSWFRENPWYIASTRPVPKVAWHASRLTTRCSVPADGSMSRASRTNG